MILKSVTVLFFEFGHFLDGRFFTWNKYRTVTVTNRLLRVCLLLSIFGRFPSFLFSMGSFFSRAKEYHTDISGSHVHVWIDSRANFDLTSVCNRTIQDAMKKFERMLIANNSILITNTVLVLMAILLPIMFLYVACCRRQFPPRIKFNANPCTRSGTSSTSQDKAITENVAGRVTGYLV